MAQGEALKCSSVKIDEQLKTLMGLILDQKFDSIPKLEIPYLDIKEFSI